MTLGVLDAEKPQQLGTRFIDKYYGQGQKPVSQWLRRTLLRVHDDTWAFGDKTKCKTYTLNPKGVELVRDMLNLPVNYTCNSMLSVERQISAQNAQIAQEWLDNAFDLSTVEYTQKSNRLWHPVQNIPKQTRTDYFYRQGLPAQYDIVACAPTLLHQMSWRYSYGHWLEFIGEYTENRKSVRERIASEVELDVKNIKMLINSLFAGGRLAANPDSFCWGLCEGDVAKIKFLQQHPYVMGLKDDIRQMWEYLRPELKTHTYITKTGKERKITMSSRNKWDLYFRLERSVMKSIQNSLDLFELKYFLLHDAFASSVLPDNFIDYLQVRVFEDTGFDIKLERDS